MKKVLESSLFFLLPINTAGAASGPVSVSGWTAGTSSPAPELSEQLEKHLFTLLFYLTQRYF